MVFYTKKSIWRGTQHPSVYQASLVCLSKSSALHCVIVSYLLSNKFRSFSTLLTTTRPYLCSYKITRDVLFQINLKFWSTASIGIPLEVYYR